MLSQRNKMGKKDKLSRVIHPKTPIFEYNKITSDIFIGTNQCCRIHFNKELVKNSVKADLSLEENKIDNPFGVDYFLWLPTKDHRASTIKQLFIGASFIDQLVKNKIKVYVHCQNGHGRAPTLVAAYFITKGMTAEEALSLIKNRRKSIHPNKHQKATLKSFEKKIKF